MSIRGYPGRVLFVTIVPCLFVIVLSGAVALWLDRELSRSAAALEQDIASRSIAVNLEVTLNNLAVLHDRRSLDLEPLHEQISNDLSEMHAVADEEQERALVTRAKERCDEYLRLWTEGQPQPKLALYLREKAVPAVDALRKYHTRELQRSDEKHRRVLRRMVWGMATVGGLAAIGGAVLGFGLARNLRRTIHRFLVRVQGVEDLLAPEVRLVEWPRKGGALGDEAEELIRRVEQCVMKLQERERDVRRAERLAAVGQLAAGVAHEIRNPLTSVILLIETTRSDPATGGLNDEDLDLIEAELHRIERSLQTLIDYARPPKLHRSRVDLVAVARDALTIARGRIELQSVQVQFDASSEPTNLDADRDQLRQVVLNLVLNALDVMPHGGTLGASVRPPGEDGMIELTVTDTGPGVRSDILPRLFEPFATSKETGLGLGLVVSKRIVTEHGGTILASNPQNGGACFTVRLPATDANRS